ncbi:MAG: hypothetical protein FGM52_01500 [Mycobacterium sp.]|nr:hypothetical protein [Mycobacterium sp.]
MSGPVRVSSRYLPTRYLGGDVFDYRWIDDDHLIITLLDVSGHGVESALLSVSVHNLLRSGSMSVDTLRSPQRVLTELNRLFPMESHGGHYFTVWYGVYRRSTRTLTYASAGHPPALVFTPTSTEPDESLTNSPPVGMLEDGEFLAATYQVDHGTQILLYSDGAFEHRTADGGSSTLGQFIDLCAGLAAAAPGWSLDDLLARLRNLSAEDTFDDDCALIQVDF